MINRLPDRRDVVPVYAVILFLFNIWTVYIYLWKLPSWIKFLTVGEMLSISAYAMATNLLESIIFLSLILLVTMVLPSSVLKDNFVVRGAWLAISIIGSMIMILMLNAWQGSSFIDHIIYWLMGCIVLSCLLFYFSVRVDLLKRFAISASSQLIVFLYISLPVSFFSVVVVTLRNII